MATGVQDRLIARNRERERTLAAVTIGRGAAIVGPAGVGKTALVKTVARHLDASRFAVLWTSATRAGQEVPFGAFAGLVTGRPRADRVLMHARIAAELARRSGRRTPVLVVDDAHHLDGPSAGLVLGLAGNGQRGSADIRLMITARPEAGVPDAVVSLWKDGYLQRLDVEPFDRTGTAQLMRSMLGAEAAGPTVELLHQWTGGSPLLLTELVRAGRAAAHLVADGGLWWWRAPLSVPPALAELFDHRLHGLSPPIPDALAAVALGEPLPLHVVEAVAPGAVEELEDRRLLRVQEEDSRVWVWLEQPLLGAAVRERLSVARRRRVAAALLTATAAAQDRRGLGPDEVTRARWQLDAGGPVDASLLLRASEAVRFFDPELACRLARRVVERSGSVPAMVALADSLVEMDQVAEARQVLERARSRSDVLVDRLAVTIALAKQQCWVDRDPATAHAELAAMRAATPSATARDELDGMDALVLLSGGRTAVALRVADRVLRTGSWPGQAGSGYGYGPMRARLARTAALTLTGRHLAAVKDGEVLVTDARTGAPAYAGLASAVLAMARLGHARSGDEVPLTDPILGRWPCGGTSHVPPLRPVGWSLFEGQARRLFGDRRGAIPRLREAVVQQAGGWRVFRSEATAWLAMCLAEEGNPDDAAGVLGAHPPDRVATVPGLGCRAAAAVAAARGDLTSARTHLEVAVQAAHAAGCWAVELEYLTDAVEMVGAGGLARMAERITDALRHVDAPRLSVLGEAALTLVRGDGAELLEHAVRLDRAGLRRHAWRLAESAATALSYQGHARRGEALVLAGRLRRHLNVPAPAEAPPGLTSRETEIAALAAAGLSDRQIADRLVVSVRTVESHLTRVYRKLGVSSRHDLPGLRQGYPRQR